jgi:hypothetical protein
VRTILPLILQVSAVDALQAHVGHTASHDIEASGERDDIVLALFSVGCDDTLFCELLDRCSVLCFRVDVHEADVVAVENLVEVLLEARTLDTKGVWRLLWEEDLVLPLILDAG